MKSRAFFLIIGIIVMVTFVVGFAQNRRPSNVQWEYKIAYDMSTEQLNELGAQGWELVSAVVRCEGCSMNLYFKRAR